MKFTYRHLFYWLIVWVIAALGVLQTQTQTLSPDGYLAIQFTEDYRILLYDVDGQGQLTLLKTLSEEFGDTWSVALPNITAKVSPDGQRATFVAYHYQYRQESPIREAALFIYNRGESELHQVPVPGIGRVIWSPNSDAILIAPSMPIIFMSAVEFSAAADLTIYDLTTDTVTTVPNSPDIYEREVFWLPDNEHIVFAGGQTDCGVFCSGVVTNLYVVDRWGQNLTVLTGLGNLPPFDANRLSYICRSVRVTWAASTQRIYYALECDWDL